VRGYREAITLLSVDSDEEVLTVPVAGTGV
jgi:hypothetical protein